MPKLQNIKKVLVIGSGPIIIGQAAEFDYAGTQVFILSLLMLNFWKVLLNASVLILCWQLWVVRLD